MANYDGAIFVGHGTSEADGSYDPGACAGSKQEHIIAEKIVDKAVKICIDRGLNIHRDEQNYKDNDLLGNTYNYKYAIEVHLNAGGGTRAELFTPCKDKDLNVEFYLMSELAKLGLKNGGVKSRDYDSEQTFTRTNGVALPYTDYYGVINRAYKQGISLDILEVGFIDSSDLVIVENNLDKIANIIANGMLMACNKSLVDNKVETPIKVQPKSELKYQGHIQNIGWQEVKSNDQICGTIGQSLRLEALTISYPNIKFRGHIQDLGWTEYRNSGEIIGTMGKGLRLEAIEIQASDLLFSVHIQDLGWTEYKSNTTLGTVGQSKRVEAIRIKTK